MLESKHMLNLFHIALMRMLDPHQTHLLKNKTSPFTNRILLILTPLPNPRSNFNSPMNKEVFTLYTVYIQKASRQSMSFQKGIIV